MTKSSNQFTVQLLHPRYWLTWFLLSLLYLLVQLPFRWQFAIGRMLGKLAYWVMPRRRHIAAINLKLCFPELSETEHKQLLKKHFAALGISLFETGMGWWWSDKKLQKLAQFEGLEYVNNSFTNQRGLLILSPHCTTMDLIGRLVSLTFPMYAVYREQKNAVIDFVLKQKRAQSMLQLIHRHDIRAIIKKLKQRHIVWYAPDQDYGRKHSVFAPFFNIPAATITMPSQYAELTKAAVLTLTYYRLDDNSGYRIVLSPYLDNFPSNNNQQDAARINQLFERAICEKPEQYLWIHRRFKTRPEGEKKFY